MCFKIQSLISGLPAFWCFTSTQELSQRKQTVEKWNNFTNSSFIFSVLQREGNMAYCTFLSKNGDPV